MPERDRGTEPSPWADPAEMKEPEPDWAKEIRARRKGRAEQLRKVFDGLDGKPLKKPSEKKPSEKKPSEKKPSEKKPSEKKPSEPPS